MSEPNNSALYDARRRQGSSGSQVLDNIVSASNCGLHYNYILLLLLTSGVTDLYFLSEPVDRDEVDRLRKRFMKLDKVRSPTTHLTLRRRAQI